MDQAISSKLNSRSLNLTEKCTLAKNVFLSSMVKSTQKECIVLEWILKTIIEKFTAAEMEQSKLEPLWNVLTALAETTAFEQYFISISQDMLWDFLSAIVDNLHVTTTEVNSSVVFMKKIFQEFKHVRKFMVKQSNELSFFVSKCVQFPVFRSDILSLFEHAIRQNDGLLQNKIFFDTLLCELLKIRHPEDNLISLVSKGLFSKRSLNHWSQFLMSLIHTPSEDTKPKSNDDIDLLFSKISSMKYDDQVCAIETIFKAGFKSNLTDSAKAIHFVMASHMLNLYPDDSVSVLQLSPLAKTLLPESKESENVRLQCLQNMIEYLINLKVDLTVNMVNENQTMITFIQHQLKSLLVKENIKDEKFSVCKLAVTLGTYCPIVIEPLIGTLSMTIMSLEQEDQRITLMCQILNLYQKLRQLPKLLARLLISLSKMESSSFTTSNLKWHIDIINCFSSKITNLPSGQLIEIWKTFEYHMKNSKNMASTLETLFPVFLLSACIVDQNIPDSTMMKYEAMIKSNREIAKDLSLTNVKNAIEEVCITLMHTRDVNTLILDENFMSNLQKRKRNDLIATDDVSTKKSKLALKWKDIKDDPPNSWRATMSKLDDEGILEAINELLSNKALSKDLVEDNPRIQHFIVSECIKRVQKSNPNANFLKHLTDDDGSLEGLSSTTCFEEFSNLDDIGNGEYLRNSFDLLPLEYLQGKLEARTTILLISLAKVDVSFMPLIARCFTNAFRTSVVLKYLSITNLLEYFTTIPNSPYHDQILVSAIKLGLTFQTPMDEMMSNSENFAKPLEVLVDDKKVNVSVMLLESLRPVLTKEIVISGEEKLAKYNELFKTLSKAFLKGLKNSEKNVEYSLVTRALTSVIEILAFQSKADSKKLKKWAPHVNTYASISLVNSGDNTEKLSNFKFLSVVLQNYNSLKEKVEESLMSNIIDKRFYDKPLVVHEEKNAFTSLIESASEHSPENFNIFASTLIEITIDQCVALNDLRLLANWELFLKANIQDNHSDERRIAIEKLLPLMNNESIPISDNTLESYYLPLLEFQASIFNLDKPILYKESEGFCLITSLLIKLDKIFLNFPDFFNSMWSAIYNVISAAFHKRPSSVVTTRIPLVMEIMRNLLTSLAKASDQKLQHEPTKIKELVEHSHHFDRLCDHMKKLKDEFARVTPYFIADMIDILQQVTIYPVVRSNLMFGLYKLLDVCDSHSTDFLSGVLPPGRQEIFKHLFNNYKQYHKYSGKV